MVPKAGYFTRLLYVMDVRRSIRFYQLPGFDLIDLEGPPECPGWARMLCEGGAVTFLLAGHAFDPTKHALLTAMNTPNLPRVSRAPAGQWDCYAADYPPRIHA